MYSVKEITFRFEDHSCARENCSYKASLEWANKFTGWYYCKLCAFRIEQFNTGSSLFYSQEELEKGREE